MLAYECKNCKQIHVWGCENEYNEHFCSEECYLKYCEKNGYTAHPEVWKFIKKILLQKIKKIKKSFDKLLTFD